MMNDTATRRRLLAIAAVLQGLALGGCSSSGSVDPPGGAPGGAGGAGSTLGAGACVTYTGTVGEACPQGLSNHDPCTGTEPPCFNSCGPLKSGVKNCACVGGSWSCPICQFDPDPSRSYACFQPPTTATPCPPDPADPSGMLLPQSGTPCSREACSACGSGTAFAYRDTSGTPKVGYCVCSATSADGGTTGKWSCASTKEWPPYCLTNR